MADDRKRDKSNAPAAAAPQRKEVKISSAAKAKEGADFRGVIRFIGKDLDGHLTVIAALRKIKGIGQNISRFLGKVIKRDFGVDGKELIGNVSEEKLASIEKLAFELPKTGIPPFLLNRQRDLDSGENKHLISSDLSFQLRQDQEREKNTRSWKGWRHQLGQRVRGQRSRSTGRTGMTVGVLKKALKQQKAAAAGAAAPGKPAEKEKK